MGAFSIWHLIIILFIPTFIFLFFIWKKRRKNLINKYDESNRFTRGDFAIRMIPVFVLSTVVEKLMEINQVLLFISIILTIILLIYQIQVIIKRFHDINMSGWYTFLIIIPFVFITLFFIPGTSRDLSVLDKVKEDS